MYLHPSSRHCLYFSIPIILSIEVLFIGNGAGISIIQPECQDLSEGCRQWVTANRDQCIEYPFIKQNCLRSCGTCLTLPRQYDIRKLPKRLEPISWLVGVWRSENDGKVVFPTIPRFTYGEQIEISISELNDKAKTPSLNYTTSAWGMEPERRELHSESGFIAINNEGVVALTTVMSNGFVTVEEGPVTKQKIQFRLVDIGRISFSRDLPLIRDWTLLDSYTLEARLQMGTLTHGLQEHTSIVYRKIFP